MSERVLIQELAALVSMTSRPSRRGAEARAFYVDLLDLPVLFADENVIAVAFNLVLSVAFGYLATLPISSASA